jgi:polyisoprenoid-binding protein YceI
VVPTTAITGTLSFDARATLGAFTGVVTTVRGAITGGPGIETVRGWVVFPVDSLSTDNGLRDRDMRKALDAEQHPEIRFTLREVRPSPIQGNSMVATLVGEFTIHGVTHPVTLPATLTWTAAGIEVSALLGMDVRDYGITRLARFLGAFKMQPDIVIRIDLLVAQPAS